MQPRAKSGELRWAYLKTTPFRNAQGEIVGRVAALGCIEKQKAIERENEILLAEKRENFGRIVGESLALKKVLSQIATAAPTEASNAGTRCEQVRFSNAKFDLFGEGNIARLNGSISGNLPATQFSYL